jgi:hypothetical protein
MRLVLISLKVLKEKLRELKNNITSIKPDIFKNEDL